MRLSGGTMANKVRIDHVGYDVEFVQLTVPPETTFPVQPGQAAGLVKKAGPFADTEAVKTLLLKFEGCKPGPKGAIDYMGKGLSYARITASKNAIHVENNCSAADLLKILAYLQKSYPTLLIVDLQSKQLHTAASYKAWWAKPL
jgi:hypothetical protein